MKRNARNIIVLLFFYCIPASFLAMLGDVEFRTLWFYILPVFGLPFLAWITGQNYGFCILAAGNILSCISSLLCVRLVQTEHWGNYFKPFTPIGMEMLIMAGSLMIQIAVWCDARRQREYKSSDS